MRMLPKRSTFSCQFLQWKWVAFSGHKGQTGPTHQLKCHGLLVESLHVGQTGLHLGLDVALVASRKPDPRDPLEQSGQGQTKSWRLELMFCDSLQVSGLSVWTLNVMIWGRFCRLCSILCPRFKKKKKKRYTGTLCLKVKI